MMPEKAIDARHKKTISAPKGLFGLPPSVFVAEKVGKRLG